jgi:hypothetical protein
MDIDQGAGAPRSFRGKARRPMLDGVLLKAPAAVRLAAVAIAIAALAGQAMAHHSFAMFDRQKEVVLKGTVRTFQWTNPHSFIELEVVDAQGAVQAYSIEMNSPNNLVRQGWKSSTLKPGDKVSVTMNPLRDGSKGGLFVSAQLPDGRVIGDRTIVSQQPRAG